MSAPIQYRVSEVYPTIQGEGELAGTPVVVLRLQGCGVGCPWCDTKHSWDENGSPRGAVPARATAAELVALVEKEARDGRCIGWVLLTGGEPAEQDLSELFVALKGAGFRIMLETSGTASGHLKDVALVDHVTVSPKQGMPGGKPIVQEAIDTASELKFVVGKRQDISAIDAFIVQFGVRGGMRVSLQPVSQSVSATKLAVDECIRRGWHLSIQQHKVLELP